MGAAPAPTAQPHLRVLAKKAREGRLDQNYLRLLDTVLGEGWSATTREQRWRTYVHALDTFVAREGHARPTWMHLEGNVELGQWVVRTRSDYRIGRLSKQRIAQLEDKPGWTWSAYDIKWELQLSALRAFVEREGHAQVPYTCIEGGVPLGRVVGTLRSKYQDGALDSDRIAVLEALPAWTWSARDSAWTNGYERITTFFERENHVHIPKTYEEDGFKLGLWLDRARRAYRNGTLPSEREQDMSQFPDWHLSGTELTWKRGVETARAYCAENGNADIASRFVLDGYHLGRFVQRTRKSYLRGELSAEQIAELESIPGWSW